MKNKLLARHIVVLLLNLIVMVGAICFLVELLDEGCKSYHVWVCCIVIITGVMNSVRSGIAIKKVKRSKEE